ncbi:MAG TPA: neutral/alkaline non-lysosomal ceramidase N-terminal domain-containing protein, partial [bacterium]|nr:neutral/alkaline non-lysosomal ceramidase N-terminal domain-containing protein [bacterium]
MKRSVGIFFILLFVALGFGQTQPYSAAGGEEILLGIGKTEITPPLGSPLAGYGKRHGKPSQGVHDPLYARALSLTKNGQTIVFISIDLVLIDDHLRAHIVEKLKPYGLEDKQVLLSATHTHSGTGAIGGRFWEKFIMGKFRRTVFEYVTQRIAEAVIQSLNPQTPVTAEYGETDIGELIENRMDRKLNYPGLLRILRFKNAQGEIKGNLVFMAAHPIILPAANFLFSADFPGVMTREIENQFPESVGLFINGAAADLRPRIPGEGEDRFERMETYGRALVEKISQIGFVSLSLEGPWMTVLKKVPLPKVKIRQGWFRVPSLLGNRIFPRQTLFQGFRLGNLIFLAFPGEVASETGYEIENRAAFYGLTPFFIGYANDFIGYVIPRRYYTDQKNYEARASFYGKKLDWYFQKHTDQLIESLLTESEKEAAEKPGELYWKENLPVLRLSGSPYHRGFEEGRLLKKEIHRAVHDIFRYFRSKLPIPFLNRPIINSSLDRAWEKMEPYVSYGEYEQMRGLAEGSGVPLRRIKRIHALPEVYPTWCANGAYWGNATADGKMLALRNLDWNREMGIQRFAAIKFYEGAPHGEPNSYVNIGYYGFTGVLTGINDRGISVGQIGATSKDETMKGVPMPFLLKRVLEEASSVEEAAEIYERSDRTRGYNYIIADAGNNRALAVESTWHELEFFRDRDPDE